MKFLNETLYNRSALDALVRIGGYTIKQQTNRRNRLLILAAALIGIALGYVQQFGPPLFVALCRACGFSFLLVALFFPFVQRFPNFYYAKNPETRRIAFFEGGFGPPVEGAVRFPYSDLREVVTTRDWIALFWDEKHGFILDRAGFYEGRAEEFLAFLQEKTALRFTDLPI